MFNRKMKFVDGWSVTRNPNKFNGDVMLSLGTSNSSYKKNRSMRVLDNFKERATIRLTKDTARELCATIMKQFNE